MRVDSPTHRGTGAPHLWLAVHEAAHAVAGLALDELPPCPGPYLRSVTVRQEGETWGMSHKPRRVITEYTPRDLPGEMLTNARTLAQFDIIESLAGPLAELRQRQGWLGVLFSKNTLIELVTGAPLKGNNDFANIQRALRWLAPADETVELKKLWDAAMALIQAEWPGIVAMARFLREKGFLDGDDFERRWSDLRPDQAKRQKRMERIGLRFSVDPIAPGPTR